jgi:hypothetical protein
VKDAGLSVTIETFKPFINEAIRALTDLEEVGIDASFYLDTERTCDELFPGLAHQLQTDLARVERILGPANTRQAVSFSPRHETLLLIHLLIKHAKKLRGFVQSYDESLRELARHGPVEEQHPSLEDVRFRQGQKLHAEANLLLISVDLVTNFGHQYFYEARPLIGQPQKTAREKANSVEMKRESI